LPLSDTLALALCGLFEHGKKFFFLSFKMADVIEQFRTFFLSLQLSEKMAEIAEKKLEVARANEERWLTSNGSPNLLKAMFQMSDAALTGFWMEAVPELTMITRKALEGMNAPTENRSSGKFADFTLGPLEVFYNGIDGMIGLPNLKTKEAIEEEHSSDVTFQAYNQGREITTSAKEQWNMVLPEGFKGAVNNKDYDQKKVICEDFMKHETATKAGLEKVELVVLRLYSGPMYVKYNKQLRDVGEKIMKYLKEQKDANKEQDITAAIAKARLETGKEFVTTLHTLVSALLKLSQKTEKRPLGKAYRGIHNLSPPECFVNETPGGGRGGVEFGFLSTTTDLDTAVTYASAGERPMIFEIDFGMVDHGADISWISYFQSEAEVLLPPLCMLQVNGAARYERTGVKNDSEGEEQPWVLVWPLKLNLNLQCLTLDQLRERRKTLHLSMTRNLIAEVERDLQMHLQSEAEESEAKGESEETQKQESAEGQTQESEDEVRAKEEAIVKDEARKVVLRQCDEVLQNHQGQPAEWFNDEDNYKKAMDESMMVKRFSLTRFNALVHHAPREHHSNEERARRQYVKLRIEKTPLSDLKVDHWKYAEISGRPDIMVPVGGNAKQVWKLICSREEIPTLKIPNDIDDHVLKVLVECMAAYPTGLREIQFGSFKLQLSKVRKGYLDLGFGDGRDQTEENEGVAFDRQGRKAAKALEVTNVPSFGDYETRMVTAVLATGTNFGELNLSFCKMDYLDASLQNELLRASRGCNALKSLRLAHCGLRAAALEFVAKYIEENTALQELDIDGNEMSEPGCRKIAEALVARSAKARRGSDQPAPAREQHFTIDKLKLPLDRDQWDLPELQTFGPKGARVKLLKAIVACNTKLVSLNGLVPPKSGSTWDLRKALGFDSSNTGNAESGGGGWASIDIPLAFVGNQPLDVISMITLDATDLQWPTSGGEERREEYTTVLEKAMQEWAMQDVVAYFRIERRELGDDSFKDFKEKKYGPLLLQSAKLGSKHAVQKLFCAFGTETDESYIDDKGHTALSWAAHCASPWFLMSGFKVNSSMVSDRLRAPQVTDSTGRVIYDPNTENQRDRVKDYRDTIELLVNNGENATVVRVQAPGKGLSDLLNPSLNRPSTLARSNSIQRTNSGVERLSALYSHSALLIAATTGHAEIVDLILKVPHAIRDDTEATDAEALVTAAAAGHPAIVSRLLEYGANVNQRHRATVTLPLPGSEPDLFTEIRIIPRVKEMYRKPTALIMATATGNAEIVDALLKGKADVSIHCAITLPDKSAKDGKGVWTPLLIAASKGHASIVDTLLSSPQTVEPAQLIEALEQATAKGHSKIVEALLAKDASLRESLPWWWVTMEKCGLTGTYL